MNLWQEYAVNPDLFRDASTALQLLREFGTRDGRLIAAFPKKWLRYAYERTAGQSDIGGRKAVEDRLAALKRRGAILRRSCDHDPQAPWLPQAIQCDESSPFYAILDTLGHDHPRVVKALPKRELDDHPLWRAEGWQKIPRRGNDLAECLKSFILRSRWLEISDPYFDPSGGTRRKWHNPLAAISRIAATNRSLEEIRIYAKYPFDGKVTFAEHCRAVLPKVVAPGVRLRAANWRVLYGRDAFHDRFIISDIGGIEITPGFDEGSSGESYVLRLMPEGQVQEVLRRFLPGSAEYERIEADDVLING